MTVSFDSGSQPLPPARIIGRGFTAAHGALLGVFWLFLLQAPMQVLTALMQAALVQPVPGQPPSPTQALMGLGYAGASLVAVAAVFLCFPLIQGGILGQVRDRIECRDWPPRSFGHYARAYYDRLLGCQGIFLLAAFAIMLPAMAFAMSLAFDEMAKTVSADGGPTATPQQINRAIFSHPGMCTGLVLAAVLASALWMVYWVAGSVVVTEGEGVIASWLKALHFCGKNLGAVALVWLLSAAVGVLMAPVSLVGQLGFVTNPWLLVVLAVVYSALVAYWGVLLGGVCLSLYLARREPAEHPESVPV
jgi:hypothetical protein